MIVQVIRNYAHPFNWLKLDLYRFESSSQMPHQLIGSLSFHMHEVIKVFNIYSWSDV